MRVAVTLCLDRDDLAAARAWLDAHDRWLAWSGAVLGRADGQCAWASYCLAAGDLGQARHHATQALRVGERSAPAAGVADGASPARHDRGARGPDPGSTPASGSGAGTGGRLRRAVRAGTHAAGLRRISSCALEPSTRPERRWTKRAPSAPHLPPRRPWPASMRSRHASATSRPPWSAPRRPG